EFRAGRPISIRSGGETAMTLPIDGMTDARLAAFRQLCAPQLPHLVVTGRRARALGIDCAGPAGLTIGEVLDAASIFVLAAENKTDRRLHQVRPAPGA